MYENFFSFVIVVRFCLIVVVVEFMLITTLVTVVFTLINVDSVKTKQINRRNKLFTDIFNFR